MKTKQVFKVVTFVILFFGVIGYMGYAMVDLRGGNPREICTEVVLTVEENPHAAFIDDNKVEELLQQAGIYPKNKLMRDVDTRAIEETLKANNFIERVECYKTNNGMEVGSGKVCIRVIQRTPVIYVLPDNQNGYYVDADGMTIPNSVYTKNIITATGNINQEYATRELSVFGEYLLNHPYWDERIEQLFVSVDKKGKRVVTLIPRIGNHTVYIGTLDQFETKLKRLQVFYEKGLPQVGWNKYSRLNLEFSNQIVCTKQ